MKRMRTKKVGAGLRPLRLSGGRFVRALEFMKAGEEEESEVDKAFESATTAVEELEFKNMLSAEEDG